MRFSNFSVDTMFLNEHAQLKKWLKLKKTSVKTLLNDHAQLKNKTKLKKTNVATLLNELF